MNPDNSEQGLKIVEENLRYLIREALLISRDTGEDIGVVEQAIISFLKGGLRIDEALDVVREILSS